MIKTNMMKSKYIFMKRKEKKTLLGKFYVQPLWAFEDLCIY